MQQNLQKLCQVFMPLKVISSSIACRDSTSICHFPNGRCYSAAERQKTISTIIILSPRSLAWWVILLTKRIFTTSWGYRRILLHVSMFSSTAHTDQTQASKYHYIKSINKNIVLIHLITHRTQKNRYKKKFSFVPIIMNIFMFQKMIYGTFV